MPTCGLVRWWWQHHAVGMFFSGRDWRLVSIEGKIKGTKYREILLKTCSRALRTSDWGQQDNDTKHTAKTRQVRLRDKSLNVLECPIQNPDLNPI